MGVYTQFFCDITLDKAVPGDILSALAKIADLNERDDDFSFLQTPHAFFRCQHLRSLFFCSSAYFPDAEQGYFLFKRVEGTYQDAVYAIRCRSSLKNYDSEITKFSDWIRPFVSCGTIWSRYEESIYMQIHLSKNLDSTAKSGGAT